MRIRPGWAATPFPDTPGRSTLRSLSEATNYDQPQVRILLGVLFCGEGLQLLLQRKSETFMTVVCPIWEAALDKAEQRAEPDENELPLIVVDDFY